MRKSSAGATSPIVDTPVHRMPVEILQKIFFDCLTEERSPRQDLAPLLLCHVCSVWRKVALQQSELWDEVWLLQDKKHSVDKTNTVFTESLKLWLSGLKQREISASIRLCLPSQPDEPEFNPSQPCTDPLIQRLLLPYSNKFRALSIDVSTDAELYQFFQLPPGQFKTLETLRLRFGSRLDDISSISAFEGAPRLRNLAIEIDNNFYLESINTRFPWTQITCLYLGNYMDVETWHVIIRQCPSIQRCALGIQAMTEDEDFDNQDAILHHLTYFCLTMTGTAYPSVFDGLLFPALTQLRIADNNNSPECGFPSWSQPLEFYGQFNNLRTLVLFQQEITLRDFITVLTATTSLVNLAIDSDFDFDKLMDSLTYRPDKENLIPYLEVLALRVVDKDRARYPVFSCSPFIGMVDSRWWPFCFSQAPAVACLQAVFLDIDDYREGELKEVEKQLSPFVSQGLYAATRLIAWEEWLEERPDPFSIQWWNDSIKRDV